MAMATASERYAFADIAPALMDEMLVRNVMWTCKKSADAKELYRSEESEESNSRLLDVALKGSMVSLRIMAFHHAFVTSVVRPASSSLGDFAADVDVLCGIPGPGPSRRFQASARRLMAMDSWALVLAAVGLKPLSAALLAKMLRGAWRTSLSKGYHTADMDFSRIHASGVSKILLSGESFTTDPGMKTIVIKDHWMWCTGTRVEPWTRMASVTLEYTNSVTRT